MLYFFSFKKFVMGVEVELILRDSNESHAQKASESAFAEMTRLDGILSNWKESSEISEINRSQEGKWVPVSKELFEVISKGMDVSKSTGGAFLLISKSAITISSPTSSKSLYFTSSGGLNPSSFNLLRVVLCSLPIIHVFPNSLPALFTCITSISKSSQSKLQRR